MTIQINGTGIITGLNDNTIAESVVSRTTPAQFDNDTSLATTEFVQRALGSFSGVVAYTSTTTLTAADIGKSVLATGTFTITLPAANSVASGSTIDIYCNSGAVTVQRAGTDLLNGVVNTTSTLLGVGDTVSVRSNGVDSWLAYNGTAALTAAARFGASLTTNGYQKLPSGLIIQWGSAAAPAAGSSSTITLPISFTTAFLSCSVVEGAAADSTTILSYGTRNHTVSNFVIANRVTSGGSSVRWIAIGY